MDLGTRWSVGAAAPSRLSPQFVESIAGVEAELVGIDTSQWRWTLTWLERRAVAELDDGTIVRENHDGSVAVLPVESD
jgi:hypothetical protein